MQCACAILSSVAWPTLYVSTLSHKRHDFWGGGEDIEPKLFCFPLKLSSEKILILRRIQGNVIIEVRMT